MGNVIQTARPRGPFGELKPLTAALTLGLGLSFAPTTYAATFTVTNLNDSGAGSLRAAITSANGAAGADTVNFQAGLTGTITLTTGEIAITDDVTITGPGAASMTITKSGAAGRLLDINVGTPTVTISGLTFQGGDAFQWIYTVAGAPGKRRVMLGRPGKVGRPTEWTERAP